MKNQKGITLITVVITVILITIIAGIAVTSGIGTVESTKVAKFETYMKMLQKKVDIIIEERTDYTNLGTSLTSKQKSRLQAILDNDTNNYIETDDVDNAALRYFSADYIVEFFDIDDVQDEIIINFSNREVISLNGVKKDGVMHYVEKGLH